MNPDPIETGTHESPATASRINELFQATLAHADALINQSEQFPDPIEAATAIAKDLAAIPWAAGATPQAIASIIAGGINNDNVFAKTLGVTNDQINEWKSRGILVDELAKRLKAIQSH